MSGWFKHDTGRFVVDEDILSSAMNQKFDEVAESFDKLPQPRMDGKKGFSEPLTVEPATQSDQAPTMGQIAGGTHSVATDSGTANNYILTGAVTWSAYTDGMEVWFKPLNGNTGPSTVDIDGLGQKQLLTSNGNQLAGGDLVAGIYVGFKYNEAANAFHAISVLLSDYSEMDAAVEKAQSWAEDSEEPEPGSKSAKTWAEYAEQQADSINPDDYVAKTGVNEAAEIPAGDNSQYPPDTVDGYFRLNTEKGHPEIAIGGTFKRVGQVSGKSGEIVVDDTDKMNPVIGISPDYNPRLPVPSGAFLTGRIIGLEISKASATDVLVQPGSCFDATNSEIIELTSQISQSISGISANTVYNVFITKTGSSVSVGFDTDVNGTNITADYKRWIGYVYTDSSSEIWDFEFFGDTIDFTKNAEGITVVSSPISTTPFTPDYTGVMPVDRVSCVSLWGRAAGERLVVYVSVQGERTFSIINTDSAGTTRSPYSNPQFIGKHVEIAAHSTSYDDGTIGVKSVRILR